MAVHPSCYRVQSKRERKYDPMWFRKALDKAFTQDEWIHKFKTELTPREQFDTFVKLQPKEIKGEMASSFTLVINGLKQPALKGEIVHDALEAHKDDDCDGS